MNTRITPGTNRCRRGNGGVEINMSGYNEKEVALWLK